MSPSTMHCAPVKAFSQASSKAPRRVGDAQPSTVPLSEQFCGLLQPGDATIHQCETVHHSAPNTTEHSRLGLLLVYRGSHTQTDPRLKATYTAAVTATPPA
jgi:ectoine hydroxylase-related dioxygenase (phytanoyl-CoA dioxygenase family)